MLRRQQVFLPRPNAEDLATQVVHGSGDANQVVTGFRKVPSCRRDASCSSCAARFSPVRRSSTPSFVSTPSTELQAGRSRDKQQHNGPNKTDLHTLHERFAMRDECPE